jgi:hypothetical protein
MKNKDELLKAATMTTSTNTNINNSIHSAGSYEHNNKPLGAIKGREFLD